MKTQVLIEEGVTSITLLPENAFEETVLRDYYDNKGKYTVDNKVTRETAPYSNKKEYLLTLVLKERNEEVEDKLPPFISDLI